MRALLSSVFSFAIFYATCIQLGSINVLSNYKRSLSFFLLRSKFNLHAGASVVLTNSLMGLFSLCILIPACNVDGIGCNCVKHIILCLCVKVLQF
jgi:hypothetical protein